MSASILKPLALVALWLSLPAVARALEPQFSPAEDRVFRQAKVFLEEGTKGAAQAIEALESLGESALSNDEARSELYKLLAFAYYYDSFRNLSALERVVEHATNALLAARDDITALTLRCDAYRRLKQTTQARLDCSRARYYLEGADEPKEKLQYLSQNLRQAELGLLNEDGHYLQAERVLNSNTLGEEAWILAQERGNIARDTGELGQALMEYERAVASAAADGVDPAFVAPLHFSIAGIYLALGDYGDAVFHYGRAVTASGYQARYLYAKCLVEVRAGYFEDAVDTCGRLYRDSPDEPVYADIFSLSLTKAGRVGEALEVLEGALTAHPGNSMLEERLLAARREVN